jgi:hypothetical protein
VILANTIDRNFQFARDYLHGTAFFACPKPLLHKALWRTGPLNGRQKAA